MIRIKFKFENKREKRIYEVACLTTLAIIGIMAALFLMLSFPLIVFLPQYIKTTSVGFSYHTLVAICLTIVTAISVVWLEGKIIPAIELHIFQFVYEKYKHYERN